MPSAIAAQVAAVRAEVAAACDRAGRDPATVRLIAVTKSQGPAVLADLAAAGVFDCGENRWDHQAEMVAAADPRQRFHAIGRLQGRQLAKLVPMSAAIHGLCEANHLHRLSSACTAAGRTMDIFLQANTSGEAAKAGVVPTALPALVDLARSLPGLHLVGLMTMAPEGVAEAEIRTTFRRLRALAEAHGLPRLSMGMSQDFALAVEEGATDIRVGTRLFSQLA